MILLYDINAKMETMYRRTGSLKGEAPQEFLSA